MRKIRTDKELIDELKIECEKEGRMLLSTEINSNSNLAHSSTYRNRIGSMSTLSKLVNYQQTTRLRKTDEELINELRIECDKLGRMLTIMEIDNNTNLPNFTTYRNRIGNSDILAKLVNYKQKSLIKKTNKELISELKTECEKAGKMLTSREIDDNSNLSSFSTYSQHIGNTKKLAELLNFNRTVFRGSNKELISELKTECEKAGRMLTSREIDDNSNLASAETYNLRFEGLENVAKLIGFEYLGNDYNVSIWEREVREYIESIIIDNNIIYNDRSILYPKELDIYIPELNIAIECNGAYWHSISMKDKKYHLTKTEDCLSKGIILIHIWDYEWETNNKSIKEYLSNIMKGYSIEAIPETKEDQIIVVDRMKPILYNNVEIYDYTKPEVIFINNYKCWNCGNIIYKIKCL